MLGAVRSLSLSLVLSASAAWAAEPELLTGRYRALTLNPNERRELKAVGLERVTGSSGRCLEEGMALDSVHTMFVEAKCASVRTSMAWLDNGKRIHVLVCAEDESRPAATVKKRQKVQTELKAWKGVTACVQGNEIHLLGWVQNASEREKLAGIARKHDLVDKVEVLGEGERE
ncbi:MAG: hypothetical protein JNK82_04065 [Myxococcaceae bacterium]|nr:hypothetical protein [Myxococcaceae bacterium]